LGDGGLKNADKFMDKWGRERKRMKKDTIVICEGEI
jgi:hypothetical protein